MTSRLALFAAVITVLPSAASAGIHAADFGALVTLTSDYVFRGVSQSREDPAIQGGFDFAHELGFYAGIWASSVQFPLFVPHESPRDVELDYYLGWRFDLDGDWGGQVALTRYTYPGTDAAFDYDYGEIDLSLALRDVLAATVSYSDDAYGFGEVGVAYELVGRRPLSDDLEISAGVGFQDLDRVFGRGYSYWNLSVTGFADPFSVSVSYIDTDRRAAEIWGDERTDARVAISLTAVIQ